MTTITPINLLKLLGRFPHCVLRPIDLIGSVAISSNVLSWKQRRDGHDVEMCVKYGITYTGD